MAAILPGYEYDIFISYRQNDNKRDGWVTNFVAALKDELEATLKNPVSIYFDENPHDGLLETHQVGASLEKKLKCLVFIPIISQTYCDTTSFAWEYEFLPFNKMAREDDLGMNITLANGNVVSRVLPIKIHDLDLEDQNTLESVLDGPLRSIDFIYKESGVNRSLLPTDSRNLNLEKSDYRNQINKVANALKEIGTSMLKASRRAVNEDADEILPPPALQPSSLPSPSKRPLMQKLRDSKNYGIGVLLLTLFLGLTFREILSFTLAYLNISPVWSDIFLYTILLFLPTLIAILFIPSDKSRYLRVARRLIPPVNVLAALITLIIIFWGKDLGAMTKKVTYEDEDGVIRSQQVLKESYMIKVILGKIQEGEGLVDSLKWMVAGITDGIGVNGGQFENIDGLTSDIEEFSLKAQIDELRFTNSDYFITGSLTNRQDSLVLYLEILNNKGQIHASGEVSDIDLFNLLDKSRDYMVAAIGLKSTKIILPFNEFVTDDISAYKSYVQGDITGALEKDSTFAFAWITKLLGALSLNSNEEFSINVADNGIKHIGKLPESHQTMFKFIYWWAKGDYKKSEKVINKYLLLYPQEKDHLNLMAHFFRRTERVEKAIPIYKSLLEEKFDESNFKNGFNLCLIVNNHKEAAQLIQLYGDKLPDYNALIAKGLISLHAKLYDNALANFEEALIDNPNYNVADSLIKVTNYYSSLSQNELDSISNAIAGKYVTDNANREIIFNYNQTGLVQSLNSGPGTIASPIGLAYLIDSARLLDFDILSRTPSSSSINLHVDDNNQIFLAARDDFILYRFSKAFYQALSYFEQHNYDLARPLFEAEQNRLPSFYFIDGYLNAIEFQKTTNVSDVIDNFRDKKFIRAEKDEYAFVVLKEGNHLIFEFNFSMDRIYPAQDNWLINIDSRRNKYKVRRSNGRIFIDRYVYTKEQNKFVKANSYKEDKAEIL